MDGYQSYYLELKKTYDEDIQKESKLQSEINDLNAELNNNQNRYFSMKLENEGLQKAIDQEMQVSRKMSGKLNEQLDSHQKEYDNVDEEMENVMEEFAAEKNAERQMVLQTFESFKNIPKTFCDEVVLEKTVVIDKMIEQITEELDAEAEKFAHMRENYIAENTDQRDAALATFLTELKTINIKLNLAVPKH